MPPQSPGALAAALAAAGIEGTVRTMCIAFATAVASWCASAPSTKGHDFNNVFFEHLREQNPQIAESITREAPMLVTKGTWDSVGMLKDLVKGVGCAGEEANLAYAILGHLDLVTGAEPVAAGWAGVFRLKGINELARQGGKNGYQIKYPDGVMKDGQLLEIKGPGDTFREGQYESYDSQSRAKTGKPPLVMSCGICKNCGNTTNCRKG